MNYVYYSKLCKKALNLLNKKNIYLLYKYYYLASSVVVPFFVEIKKKTRDEVCLKFIFFADSAQKNLM